jgi:tetratricopeptide (TPR) repeat protein
MAARLGAVALLAGVLLCGSAHAQTTQQLIDTCYSPDASDAITSCTALIQSGRYSGTELSHYYNNRGVGYHGKSQDDLALQDYTMAVQLDATNAEAYKNRGDIYARRNDNADALVQLNEAIRLKPDYRQAYTLRAKVKQALGDTAGALADTDMAAKLAQ